MPSVREALEKISELESRKAILECLITYLETHYRSSDAGEPDMTIARDDMGLVPEEHIDAQLELLVVEVDSIKKELGGWKDLSILPPGEEEDAAIAKKARRGKRKRGTQGQRTNQAGPRSSGSGGAGQAA